MEYRGKEYSVVQGLDTMWKWSVPALVGQTKSGKAENHAAGVKAAQRAIDKARLRRANFLDRERGNLRRVSDAGLCDLDYLLGDHLGYGVVAILQANGEQCSLVGFF
jgi:hypothetical protein